MRLLSPFCTPSWCRPCSGSLSEQTSPCRAICPTAPVKTPHSCFQGPSHHKAGLALLWGQQFAVRGNPLLLPSLPPPPLPPATGILQEAARTAPFAAPHPAAGWEAATQRGKELMQGPHHHLPTPSGPLARGYESQGGWRELPCGNSREVRKKPGGGDQGPWWRWEAGSHFSISPHPHSDLLSLPSVVGLMRARRWSPVLSLCTCG